MSRIVYFFRKVYRPSQATLMIMVGDQAVTCVDGQEVPLAAAGFDSGSIGPCPIANTFCENGGCVNDCSNQGKWPLHERLMSAILSLLRSSSGHLLHLRQVWGRVHRDVERFRNAQR